MRSVCSGCHKVLNIPDNFAGRRCKCPGCGQEFIAPPVPQVPEHPCPNCGVGMADAAVLCTACGYNRSVGRVMATKRTPQISDSNSKMKLGLMVGGGMGAAVVIIAIMLIFIPRLFERDESQSGGSSDTSTMAPAEPAASVADGARSSENHTFGADTATMAPANPAVGIAAGAPRAGAGLVGGQVNRPDAAQGFIEVIPLRGSEAYRDAVGRVRLVQFDFSEMISQISMQGPSAPGDADAEKPVKASAAALSVVLKELTEEYFTPEDIERRIRTKFAAARSEDIPDLILALEDARELRPRHGDRVMVGALAADALGRLGSRQALTPLLQVLRNRGHLPSAAAAIVGIEECPEREAACREAVDILLAHAQLPNHRKEAVTALAALGGSAKTALRTLLKDQWAAEMAAKALCLLPLDAADVPSIAPLLRLNLRTQEIAAHMLIRIGSAGTQPLADLVVDSIHEEKAIKWIQAIPEPDIAPLAELLKHGDARVRMTAIRLLSEIRAAGATTALVTALADREVEVWMAAATALAAHGNQAAATRVAQWLSAPVSRYNGRYIDAGVRVLSQLDFPGAVRLLLMRMDDSDCKVELIASLGQFKGPPGQPALPLLRKLIEGRFMTSSDENLRLRSVALAAYVEIGAADIETVLYNILMSEPYMAEDAAKRLVNRRTPTAYALLFKAFEGGNSYAGIELDGVTDKEVLSKLSRHYRTIVKQWLAHRPARDIGAEPWDERLMEFGAWLRQRGKTAGLPVTISVMERMEPGSRETMVVHLIRAWGEPADTVRPLLERLEPFAKQPEMRRLMADLRADAEARAAWCFDRSSAPYLRTTVGINLAAEEMARFRELLRQLFDSPQLRDAAWSAASRNISRDGTVVHTTYAVFTVTIRVGDKDIVVELTHEKMGALVFYDGQHALWRDIVTLLSE